MSKLTSKQQVQAAFPNARYKANPDGIGGYIYFESNELVGSIPKRSGCIGEGSNPNQAWNNAVASIPPAPTPDPVPPTPAPKVLLRRPGSAIETVIAKASKPAPPQWSPEFLALRNRGRYGAPSRRYAL